MKNKVKIIIGCCMFMTILGCSNELEEAKENATAGIHMYEDSQNLEGDKAIRAGLKWLFGVLVESDIPEKKMDSELNEQRNYVLNLLSDKYLMSDKEIKEIYSIKDESTRNTKIESIYKQIADKIAREQELAEKKQRLEERKQKRERLKQVAEMDPQIGMTSEEVVASKWGKPDHINTSVTKYGKSEQWVYHGYRYVYLDDGVVTSVQY